MYHGDIPEGMVDDAADTWPPRELIDSFLGGFALDPRDGVDEADDTIGTAPEFRMALGRFGSGVTVVASMTPDGPVGMTCQSFTSVSLSPPLVLFAPAKSSRAWPRMQSTGHFCVNILAADQEDISNRFASPVKDRFATVEWTPTRVTGAPQLEGTLGFVDCTIHAVHEAGDHFLVLGRVRDLGLGEADKPLLFYRSSYHRLP